MTGFLSEVQTSETKPVLAKQRTAPIVNRVAIDGETAFQFIGKMAERFWRYIRHGKPDDYWVWTDAKSGGYGAFGFRFAGRTWQFVAHRISWLLHRGRIPKEMCVSKNCPGGDNRACCKLAQLWLGTRADNNVDTVRKRRHWSQARTQVRNPGGQMVSSDQAS